MKKKLINDIKEISKLMYEKSYNVSIDGNISVKIDENKILVTASGSRLGFLNNNDIIEVDINGNILNGNKKPTSELPLHLNIYKNRKDINAIIHAHAPNSIVLSLIDIDIENDLYINMAPIPITEYAMPSSIESFEKLKPFLYDYNWVILKRHGVVTYEKDLLSAFLRLEGMEHFAKIMTTALSINREIAPLDNNIKNKLLTFFGIK